MRRLPAPTCMRMQIGVSWDAMVRILDIRGLNLWLFERASVVIRLKKMDEDGKLAVIIRPSRRRTFDAQLELPGLPLPKAVRLTAGYLA